MLHSLAMTGGGNHHLMTMWSTPVTSSTILYFSRIWIRSPKYTKLDVAKKVRVRILWGSLESLLGGSGRPPTFCSLSFLGVFVCNSYLWIKQLHIPRSWVFFNCLHHMYENYQKKLQKKWSKMSTRSLSSGLSQTNLQNDQDRNTNINTEII